MIPRNQTMTPGFGRSEVTIIYPAQPFASAAGCQHSSHPGTTGRDSGRHRRAETGCKPGLTATNVSGFHHTGISMTASGYKLYIYIYVYLYEFSGYIHTHKTYIYVYIYMCVWWDMHWYEYRNDGIYVYIYIYTYYTYIYSGMLRVHLGLTNTTNNHQYHYLVVKLARNRKWLSSHQVIQCGGGQCPQVRGNIAHLRFPGWATK